MLPRELDNIGYEDTHYCVRLDFFRDRHAFARPKPNSHFKRLFRKLNVLFTIVVRSIDESELIQASVLAKK